MGQEDGNGHSRLVSFLHPLHELRDEQLMDKTTQIAIAALQELSATVTIDCAVAQPIQGNMQQLAADRWQFMYPSTSS